MKNSEIRKKLKKSLRFKLLIMLGILLVFNTFAWFVYSSTINTGITATVKSWEIAFNSENQLIQEVEFNIEELYPGMPDYNDFVTILNYGEIAAEVSYEIEEIKILNETYSKNEYTSVQLLNILNTNPFQVTFNFDKTTILPETDYVEFSVDVSWPYENNNDEADTLWGHDAYDFNLAYPGVTQITIKLVLTATQVN